MAVTHLAGIDVTFGAHLRQRCAWCGAVLDDKDLTRVAVQLNEDGTVPNMGHWPVGKLVTVDGRVTYVNDGEPSAAGEGVKVPDDCCLLLPPEITYGPLEGADT